MDYLTLGTIVDSFGLDGTLKLYSTTNNQKLRYKKGAIVFLFNQKDNSRTQFIVNGFRSSGKFDFVKLDSINDKTKADSLKGFELQVEKNSTDLKVGYYFYSDLRACLVVDQNNNELGIVNEIEEFPAQLTLRVKRKNGKDFFVPFIKQFILSVDIRNKKITINVIEGML